MPIRDALCVWSRSHCQERINNMRRKVKQKVGFFLKGFQFCGSLLLASCFSGCSPLISSELHAAVNQTYFAYPVTVSLNCFHGYRLSRNLSVLTCNESGLWYPAPQPCEPMACDLSSFNDFNATLSSFASEGAFVNSTAKYSCKDGFEIGNGTAFTKLECVVSSNNSEQATWKGSTPPCMPIICEEPPQPANGAVKTDGHVVKSTAVYTCSAGYRLSGLAQRTCMLNKSWSGVAPECLGKAAA